MKAKDKIIQAAKNLFFDRGIIKVSITEIISDANVSKMTFYRNFKNKDELILEIVTGISNQGIQDFKEVIKKEITFQEKLIEVIDFKIEYSKHLSLTFLQDLYSYFSQKDTEVLTALERIKSESNALFVQEILLAKSKGEISEDISVEFIMYMMNKLQEMMNDDHLLHMFSSSEEMTRSITKFFFFGISK
ncbi:TetR/AcrR family transcriptional regulator [Flammeovirga sp. SubArs3]|uniref:TetR/AcrR family transcriptional regulator n=1 Tax=Flammeovirga sp. SubArs3 TaxID=2995316 RepID=UPI00248C2524|nr:TetR/AcrR family transcriptional regulator [Flammeovirga sp. SubArs3]